MVQQPRRLRVMQSFGRPRATSNPYIHLLDAALDAEPSVEHLRFDRRRALLGAYDVIHFHWPETLLGGSNALKRLARKTYATLLVLRFRLSRIIIVRTRHNLDLPSDLTRWDRWLLETIERNTAYYIVLNPDTPVPTRAYSSVIPHGHYRDWFADVDVVDADPHSFGFVGLVRRYKGVEALIDAFRHTRETLPDWSLQISGNPSPGMAAEVRPRAAADRRIRLDLRFLSEADFARAIMSAQGIVLPYRAMHNSGAALAALSLSRPVLVPRNSVNEALSSEVGSGWVHMFDDVLRDQDLRDFASALTHSPPTGVPDLDERGWRLTGARHAEAYAAAAEAKGSRR